MLFEPFSWIVHLLYKRLEDKRMDAHDRKTDLLFRQRAIHHADIPPTDQVEAALGPRFGELLDLFCSHDPLNLHTHRSREGRDHRHAEYVRRMYRSLTRTYGHRIMQTTDPVQLRSALRVELGLWFGTGTYDFLNDQDPEDLMPVLVRWRQRWDFR